MNSWYQKNNFYICYIDGIPNFHLMVWDEKDHFEWKTTIQSIDTQYELQYEGTTNSLQEAKIEAINAAKLLLTQRYDQINQNLNNLNEEIS